MSIVWLSTISGDFHGCHLVQFHMQKINKASALNGSKNSLRALQKRNPNLVRPTCDVAIIGRRKKTNVAPNAK